MTRRFWASRMVPPVEGRRRVRLLCRPQARDVNGDAKSPSYRESPVLSASTLRDPPGAHSCTHSPAVGSYHDVTRSGVSLGRLARSNRTVHTVPVQFGSILMERTVLISILQLFSMLLVRSGRPQSSSPCIAHAQQPMMTVLSPQKCHQCGRHVNLSTFPTTLPMCVLGRALLGPYMQGPNSFWGLHHRPIMRSMSLTDIPILEAGKSSG